MDSSLREYRGTCARQSPKPRNEFSKVAERQSVSKEPRTFVQSGACERSGIGKPVQGVVKQFARTRFDVHNVQISDYRYVEKVFENLQQK